MEDQLRELVAIVLGQPQLGLVAILIDELHDRALDHVGAVVVGVQTERGDQALVDGLLDLVDVRDAARDVARLDDQTGKAGAGRRLAAVRLLRKLAFVQLVDEQHADLLE